MKFVITSIALALMTTASVAAPKCWQAKGNWVGGDSFTNCERVDTNNKDKPRKCEITK